MTWLSTQDLIRFSDFCLILATIMGPILAVRAQKIIEGATERKRAKLRILFTLMATRAARLTHEHVQALNMIDITFYGTKIFGWHFQTKWEKQVCKKWAEYYHYLCNSAVTVETPPEITNEIIKNRWDLFIKLLYSITKCMGYDFTEDYLKSNNYSPQAHSEAEDTQQKITKSLAKILTGEQSIPMAVTHFPFSPEAIELQTKVQTALVNSLSGKTPLKVKIEDGILKPV